MNVLQEVKEISKKMPGRIYYEYDMRNLNWFNVGGPTKIFFKPNTLNELIFFFEKIF